MAHSMTCLDTSYYSSGSPERGPQAPTRWFQVAGLRRRLSLSLMFQAESPIGLRVQAGGCAGVILSYVKGIGLQPRPFSQ